MLTTSPKLSDEEIEKLPIGLVTSAAGWIHVGHLHMTSNHLHIYRCNNVRRWTSGKGLGYVTRGPSTDVTLDPDTTVMLPRGTLLAIRPCPEAEWIDYLRDNHLKTE